LPIANRENVSGNYFQLMTDIYILNYLGNTKPNDLNSFDSIIINNNGQLGKYRSARFIKNGSMIHRFKEVPFNFTLNDGEAVEDGLIRRGSFNEKKDFTLTKIHITPGQYYPRIYRPFLEENTSVFFEDDEHISDGARHEILKKEYAGVVDYPIERRHLLLSVNQLATLKEMLISVFNTVYPVFDADNPDKNNLTTYGHNIKNLLVLACIEVETQLKGIYKAHENAIQSHYSTKDYVKLKNILHLDKYEVHFPFYSDLPSIQPFKNWNAQQPTGSLDWYDSYNAIKHNSENEFHRANLGNAIYAVSAVAVLIKAQYGDNIPFWKEQIGSFFELNHDIQWAAEEKIFPPNETHEWTPISIGI
jgi:hypothetical protein